MLETKTPTRFALALLAVVCLTPVAPAEALQSDRFQVSTTPAHVWSGWPRIAMNAQGGFVVVWEFCPPTDDYCPSTDTDVRAQHYGPDGKPRGGELVVNTTSAGWQMYAAIAMDADGDSVVTWSGNGPGDSNGVFAQRYNERGWPEGPEFRVNTTTANGQGIPSVATDAAGNFVVAWLGNGPGDDHGIFAQRYNAAGEPQGGEFRVNTTTANGQWLPSVAMDADGDFVVAWSSYSPGDDYDILAQRFDAAGAAQGGEVRINTTTAGRQSGPSVAMDADGDIVVTWLGTRDGATPSGTSSDPVRDVFAQRFDAAGNPLGGEFQVNSTSDGLDLPDVTMDDDGDFVVVWDDYGLGIIAQRYDAAGRPQGGEIRVHPDRHTFAGVAMDADGDFVVAYPDFAGNLDGEVYLSIFARRFEAPWLSPTGDLDADGRADILWHNAATGSTVLWQMDGFTRLAARPIGSASTPWRIVGVADLTGDTRSDVLWRNGNTGATVLWQMDGFTRAAAGGIGAPSLDWRVAATDDFDGDAKVDILWRNEATGAALIWRMDGFTKLDAGGIGRAPLDWRIAGTGDFDGDGKADVLWRNTATGRTVIWRMNGSTKLDAGGIGAPSTAWQVAGTGDFDGDGKADVLWRNSATGNAIVWQMNDLERAAAQSIGTVPLAWTVAQLRDTNGDGLSDIVWRNTGTGATVVWRMSGFTRVAAEAIGSVSSDWDLR